MVYSIRVAVREKSQTVDVGAQLSWESICLTSRGSQVRALLFPPKWPGSSVGQNASLSRQRSTVRARSGSPFKGIQQSFRFASVAQLVEQWTENPRVVGSIPTGGTKYADVAHLVERHLAKVEVASSSLVIRSIKKRFCLNRQKRFFNDIRSCRNG